MKLVSVLVALVCLCLSALPTFAADAPATVQVTVSQSPAAAPAPVAAVESKITVASVGVTCAGGVCYSTPSRSYSRFATYAGGCNCGNPDCTCNVSSVGIPYRGLPLLGAARQTTRTVASTTVTTSRQVVSKVRLRKLLPRNW